MVNLLLGVGYLFTLGNDDFSVDRGSSFEHKAPTDNVSLCMLSLGVHRIYYLPRDICFTGSQYSMWITGLRLPLSILK